MEYHAAIKIMTTDRNVENRNKTASSKVVYVLFRLYKRVLLDKDLKTLRCKYKIIQQIIQCIHYFI